MIWVCLLVCSINFVIVHNLDEEVGELRMENEVLRSMIKEIKANEKSTK